MEIVNVSYDGNLAVIILKRTVTNAINMKLLTSLEDALNAIKENEELTSVVLGGNEKFFSIGFDLPELIALPRNALKDFFHKFNQVCLNLFTFPKSIVAAIAGHATAGGCILALCCDYRYIAEGRKLLGLNEIKLGLPVPYLAYLILHDLIGTRYARDVVESGDLFAPEQSLQMGLVDQVLPMSELWPQTVAKAKLLGEQPGMALAMIKHSRVAHIEQQVLAQSPNTISHFLDCWYSQLTQQRLTTAIAKF